MLDPQLADSPITHQPYLHLVYASLDLPISSFRIHESTATGNISIDWTHQDPQRCLGRVQFNQHTLHVAGLATPLPQELTDRTVMVSPWEAQIKAAMRHHRVHVSLVYENGHPDPIEQMMALYRAASIFENEDLLGIVNPNAWTAHPPNDYLTIDRINHFRDVIPFNLWFGYVRFYTDHEAFWLVTKGHHVFDVPDLAYFVQPGQDTDVIINLLINVFYYLFEEDVEVVAGDTLSLQGSSQKLVFSEVTELTEELMGPSGTLVITRETSVD